MLKQTINHSFQSINWLGDCIVDWCRGGERFLFPDGIIKQSHVYFGYRFDSGIQSDDGQYAFVYQKLGTKGLLLKNGKILREINRSYYFAEAYEYPAAFLRYQGTEYLVHSPFEYCQIDFENVETGEIITNLNSRKPADIFHSRLEVSKSGKYLMSKGWVWHPVNVVCLFNIEDCFQNPLLLDNREYEFPNAGSEICTASFIDDNRILVGTSEEVLMEETRRQLPAKSIGIWNFRTNTFSNVFTPDFEFGNLFSINETLCWDTYKFPKLINLINGKIINQAEDVNTGEQKSSILLNNEDQPQIAFDENRNRLAVKINDKIIVLTRDHIEEKSFK